MILQVRKNDFNSKCWNEILSIFTDNGHHVNNYHILDTQLFVNAVYSYIQIVRNYDFEFVELPKIHEFCGKYKQIMLIQENA